MDSLLETTTTTRDAFALMVHDRVVELERAVARLCPRRDPAVRVRDGRRRGATFARVRTSRPLDGAAWARDVVARLGGSGGRWDLRLCQHWNVLGRDDLTHVTEAVVTTTAADDDDRAGGVAHAVGHACLDAARGVADADARVEVADVACSAWLCESVRAASRVARRDVLYAWDGAAVTETPGPADDAGPDRAWALLHGWLAAQVDDAEPWHPKALSASAAAAEFATRLGDAFPFV